MATAKYFFIFALICTGNCNSLGQTTLCESAQNYPAGGSTVCESTPNLPYYPYGLPWGGLGGTGLLTNGLGFSGLPYSGLTGSTSVCENVPNVGMGLPSLGYLNPLYGLSLGLPYGLPTVPAITAGSTTMCESAPNVLGVGAVGGLPLPLSGLGFGGLGLGGLGLGGLGLPNVPAITPGSTTICESAPNALGVGPVGGLPLPLSGLGFGALGLGGLGLGGLSLPSVPAITPGSTTVCESAPNALSVGPVGGLPLPLSGLGFGGLGLGGLGLGGLGLPSVSAITPGSTTVCESAPNALSMGPVGGLPLPLSGLGFGGLGLGGLGLPTVPAITPGSTTVCESAPSALGVGAVGGLPLPLSGLGFGGLGLGGLGLGGLGLGGLSLGGLGYGLGQAAIPFL